MNIVTRAALAATGLVLLSANAFAATTTINVMLMGEGGGEMKIQVDKATVPGGEVVFDVTNHAMTEEHEMILVKLKTPDDEIPLNMKKHRVDEKQLKTLGEVAELKPSDSGMLKAKLKPGAYMLLCNIKGHYEAGMWTKLTVTN